MDAHDTTEPRFRRRLFGYRRDDVDQHLEALRRSLAETTDELTEARGAADTAGALGHHLAGMLTRFAEAVTAGEQEAEARAADIIAAAEARAAVIESEARLLLAQARDLTAQTFAEAARRYDAALVTRQSARERLDGAIRAVNDAIASIEALPDFPELSPPVPSVDPDTQAVTFDLAS